MESKVNFINKYYLFRDNLANKSNNEDIYARGKDVIYDLVNEEGFDAFRKRYGFPNTLVHYRTWRYWLVTKDNPQSLIAIREEDCDNIIEIALPYIESRFITDMYAYEVNNDDSKECIGDYTEMFNNCIDFAEYAVDNSIISKKYKWKCHSLDGAYDAESKEVFETKKECYEDMREAALEKMKWNTEYEDCDECDSIGYSVSFAKDCIYHESYSGKYEYKIVETY